MQDSPLVLTLSQLDEKYFKGLEAQESFRLHSQLHYEGSLSAEDYIRKKNLEKRKRRRAYWEAEWARLDEQVNAKIKAEREQMKKERLAKVKADKAADEALGRKAEEIKMSEDKDEPVVIDEHHKYHDDAAISVSTGSPHLSPKSIDSTAETYEKQQVPPVSGGPPPTPPTHIEEDPLPIHPRPAYDSVAECTPRTRTLSYAPSWKAVSF
ncbi:hypothetical protein FOMA001_g17493 [Fusarium oxysporum f. sp. matthiolae]|nr:hypothetical protein FOMA001_g17493 [Fusarium oxysporum f. sp. matthiolae]